MAINFQHETSGRSATEGRFHLGIYRCRHFIISGVLIFLLSACLGARDESPTPGVTPESSPAATVPGQTEPASTPEDQAPTSEGTAAVVSTPSPAAAQADLYYGIIQPVTTSNDVRSPEAVAQALQEIKALGGNMVLQLFNPDLTPEDWKAYLDVAQQEGMPVIGRIGPADWNPDPADLSPIVDVLAVVGEHPALYGFIYLHEPWEVLQTGQMQAIYQEIKAAHPNLRLGVIWSGEIERSMRRPDPRREFTDGLCDICLVNLKAFQNDPALSIEDGLGRMENSAGVIQQVDPDAELWSSAQVWAPPGGGQRGFRVPAPEEMESLFCTLQQAYPLKGFLWAAWEIDLPNVAALDSAELADQRQAVGDIFNTCVQSP